MTGKVKNFNPQKGYGFITGDDGQDAFFHWSSIKMDGYKTVNIGDKVEYEAVKTERGLRAENVTVIQ
ncbi:MAG: cold shock domain-containing protein [Bacilli bacterium]|nr:cold shock domain-containing protein [Bacilli bacterium]